MLHEQPLSLDNKTKYWPWTEQKRFFFYVEALPFSMCSVILNAGNQDLNKVANIWYMLCECYIRLQV